jgi:hypothetical protein
MYSQHGESVIQVQGDLIIINVSGAFNEEGMSKSIENLKAVVETFSEKKFKLLIDYSDTEGATPQAYKRNNEGNAWLNSQNMAAKAIVIRSSVLLGILESRTPERKSQNAKNFDNKPSALAWLKTQ